jgi:hypothetical protein
MRGIAAATGVQALVYLPKAGGLEGSLKHPGCLLQRCPCPEAFPGVRQGERGCGRHECSRRQVGEGSLLLRTVIDIHELGCARFKGTGRES